MEGGREGGVEGGREGGREGWREGGWWGVVEEKREKRKVEKDNTICADMNTNVHMYSIYAENMRIAH